MSEFESLTYTELKAKKEELDRVLAAKAAEVKKEGIAKYKALLDEADRVQKEYELSDADVGKKVITKPKDKRAGTTQPHKYRNPATGETCASPNKKWLKEALAQGRRLEEFLIDKP